MLCTLSSRIISLIKGEPTKGVQTPIRDEEDELEADEEEADEEEAELESGKRKSGRKRKSGKKRESGEKGESRKKGKKGKKGRECCKRKGGKCIKWIAGNGECR